MKGLDFIKVLAMIAVIVIGVWAWAQKDASVYVIKDGGSSFSAARENNAAKANKTGAKSNKRNKDGLYGKDVTDTDKSMRRHSLRLKKKSDISYPVRPFQSKLASLEKEKK